MCSPDTNSQNDKRLRFGLFEQESSGNNAPSNDTGRLIPDFSSLCLEALANSPGPLGLRLKKTPSAIALLQMELAARPQTKDSKQAPETTDDEPNTVAATASAPPPSTVTAGSTHKNSGNTTDPNTATAAAIATSTVKTATTGRPKAAHSPAVLLRIGTWEFASKYEGDIVAKIYFGKCQLIWEITEDRKLKKLEINWSDVLALRKDCSAADYDTLQIVLHNPPRCFEEVATQPKKHTLWAKCTDFTNWQADTNSSLKLPADKAQNYDDGLANYPAPALPGSENSTLDGSQDPSFPFTCQLNLSDMEYPDLGGSWNGNLPANSFFSGDQDMVSGSVSSEPLSQEPFAPTKDLRNSVASNLVQSDLQPGVNPNNLNGVQNQMQEYCYGQYISLGTEPLIPANGPASEEYIVEQITSSDSAQADTNMDEDTRVTLQKLAQHLLSDAPSASGSSGCISRVASLCQLLENSTGDDRNSVFGTDYASAFTSDDVNRASASESRAAMNFQAPESEEAMSFQAPESSPEISEDSSEELLFTLPRIASLPHFVIEKK